LPSRPPILRRAGKAFRYAGLSSDQRLASYFYWLSPDVTRSLVALKAADDDEIDPMVAALRGMPSDAAPLDRLLGLECRFFLADHNLPYNDKMSMAAGVETRVPFLDNDLAELAFSRPPGLKQKGAVGKWVLREAVKGLLPASVLNRPKTGFAMPLRELLRGPLHGIVGDIFASRSFRERGTFHAPAVERLIEDDRKGLVDASYPIFSILAIELWCRLNLDRRKPA
jgi:asparagine synthase (glutamine-hydrolysing)